MRKTRRKCFGTPSVFQLKTPSAKDSRTRNLLRRLLRRFVTEQLIWPTSCTRGLRRYLDTRGISERSLGFNITKLISTTRRRATNTDKGFPGQEQNSVRLPSHVDVRSGPHRSGVLSA